MKPAITAGQRNLSRTIRPIMAFIQVCVPYLCSV